MSRGIVDQGCPSRPKVSVKEATIFEPHLIELANISERGDAREESYYAELSTLLEAVALATDRYSIEVTIQPAPQEGGNPDFRVWKRPDHIVGYVEAKALETNSLDEIEVSEQLQRYQETLPNLLLKNFLELRLW